MDWYFLGYKPSPSWKDLISEINSNIYMDSGLGHNKSNLS